MLTLVDEEDAEVVWVVDATNPPATMELIIAPRCGALDLEDEELDGEEELEVAEGIRFDSDFGR